MTALHHTPARTQTIGMWLFLTSLTMLFAAGMLGYAIIRLTSSAIPETFAVRLPATLWISTALVLAASFTIHRALRAIQHEKRAELRQWLWATLALAVGFIAVQVPSMLAMLASHRQLLESRMPLYGLIFFLVLVHAAHVVGGVIALITVLGKALRDGYDHEHHTGVYHSALYWHFLDIVWFVMFGTMLVLG
jgi:cytochrome c oxidase subunit 3